MPKTKIYKLQLLDIPLSNGLVKRKQFLIRMKNLVTDKQVKDKNIDPDLFHNDQVQYSPIQIGRYQGAVELTAMGKKAVKTLKFWYKQFKKENKTVLQNVVIIQERYTPVFLSYQKNYRIRTMLINDDLAKELNGLKDKFARQERLEKYLYGNIKRFFKHIGYQYNDKENYLKVNVEHFSYHDKALPVYHDNKKTAIDIRFKVNIRLPQSLRLGQSTAVGYGKILHI